MSHRVRLLAGVLRYMNDQRRPRTETLIAVVALEREHVRVRAIVHEQRGFLLKTISRKRCRRRAARRYESACDPPRSVSW